MIKVAVIGGCVHAHGIRAALSAMNSVEVVAIDARQEALNLNSAINSIRKLRPHNFDVDENHELPRSAHAKPFYCKGRW